MGSCVSVHKAAGTPESAMKMGVSFGSSKGDKLEKLVVLPESPVKEKLVTSAVTVDDLPIKRFHSYGSKEDTFFDSQPWLESDGEDDFQSVRGNFTPSRGSTPVHHSFAMGTPKSNKPVLEVTPPDHSIPEPTPQRNKPVLEVTPPDHSIPEPSPTGKKKKRLSELFQDSMRERSTEDNESTPKSAEDTPYISGVNSVCSSERTPNGKALVEEKWFNKSMQGCLPSLVSCHSFSYRKKKMMSPPAAVAVNGVA
ncbi:unnamed protein product [Linum tenue]|uniref:Uncharacterized protein n=1 Tax=Linum tenue TaxID=586396 RepID=A0AAV0NE81_9ROSI|nr:unnamed protein product [Linum tenue]